MTPPVPPDGERKLDPKRRRRSPRQEFPQAQARNGRSQYSAPGVTSSQIPRDTHTGRRDHNDEATHNDTGARRTRLTDESEDTDDTAGADDPAADAETDTDTGDEENETNTEHSDCTATDDRAAARRAVHTHRVRRNAQRHRNQDPHTPRSTRNGDSSTEQTESEAEESAFVTVPRQQLVQLQNALVGVAHAANISIGAPCTHCERSYMLVSDGLLSCPHCGYRRSL
ncbi:uncharacterized protein Nmag_0651 [Natrialba magadii ATCC 43099]|uniref:Uncharacterized protein n=1 Tax=Natrialba magadii (strain ATCC 43099 / DSM 3394 / CCM 3739 / CIP 104546 / IAM 13178 / JCM 8861 / NBRC 102185 / NCIMB 2190 / MS3) TaxID=547559 RepID=D3SZA2_NATMM|nr:uncharacterized protein Nmag_0651 [Natrialba magadii ATCC 43099]ELY26639.1 hypothetical protein C500_15800 [Natrialba magadii ATCC 43099]